MNIIILGPQGSGKGTQADIISKKYNIPHISSGDIFRDEIEKNTNLGKTIKRLINQGNLVPDDLTAEIIKNKLSKSNLENGVIFDGFPRNLHQAEFLDEILKINLVFEVWINDKESIKRISGRRSCPKCAKVFHLKYNPPTKPNICDKCASKLIIREDDKEEAVKKRLKIYHEETEPIIKYYKKQGLYHKIDGRPAIPEVTKQIMKMLDGN